ncbi:Hypothetical predicted protein [Paramuricea clavata]|uniref:Uncharacterized protein n=1 Tax=Paramuricea clavata TaxID=317549 RepID=A0A7D9LA53_PARCT|nr:Hypothetical predicted protein [Paramuricea clavata]
MEVEAQPIENPIVEVKVSYVPSEVPNKVVAEFLGNHGKVETITREMTMEHGFPTIETGTKVAKMIDIKTDFPRKSRIGHFLVEINIKTFNGTPLQIVNIYAPTVGTDRLNFLSQLDKYLLTRRKVIMGGDFNLVLDIDMDRFGGSPRASISSPELKRLLSKYHLIDIWRHQHSSLKRDRSIMSRLDKFYISVDLVDDNWTEAKILFSDVGEWWDEGKAEIKHIIIEYSKAVRQQINEQRVHLMNKFHRLSEKTILSPHELEQLQRVRNNKKHSHFFFQRERYNAPKKLVNALKTVNGRVTDSDGIMKELVRFYKNLYTAQLVSARAQEEVLLSIDRKLSEEEKLTLEAFHSEEECLAALYPMPALRTPESDGLPKEFYVCFGEY